MDGHPAVLPGCPLPGMGSPEIPAWGLSQGSPPPEVRSGAQSWAFFPGSGKAVSGEAERRGGWLPCEEERPRDHTNSKARERVSNFWFVQSSGLQPPPTPPVLILRDLESFLLCYLVAPVRVLSFAFQSTLANTELWNSVFPPSAHNRRHRTSWMGQGSGGGGSDFFLRALPIFLHHK